MFSALTNKPRRNESIIIPFKTARKLFAQMTSSVGKNSMLKELQYSIQVIIKYI